MQTSHQKSLQRIAIIFAILAHSSAGAEPYLIGDLSDLINQTSSIVEVTISNLSYEFIEDIGPRTQVEAEVETTHRGTTVDSPLNFAQFGGRFPDGSYLFASFVPHLAQGDRYLLFLRNTSWHFSPLLPAVFRITEINGKELLASPDGHFVTAVTAQGIQVSNDPVFDASIELMDPFASPQALSPIDVSLALSLDEFLTELDMTLIAIDTQPSGTVITDFTAWEFWHTPPDSPDPIPNLPPPPERFNNPEDMCTWEE